MADEFDPRDVGSAASTTTVADDPIGQALALLAGVVGSIANEPVWPLTDVQVQDRFAEALRVRAGLEELTVRVLRSVSDRELPELAPHGTTPTMTT